MNPPPIRILVIDDEVQMLNNLVTILRAEGFDPTGAVNGEQGLALIRSLHPDLVVCDVMMPGMDGFGVLDAVRREPSISDVPFVFLTARSEGADVRGGMNRGADDYLTKPVKIDDLLATIWARLKRQRQSEAARRSAAALPDSSEIFRELGLTPRESEVMRWLVQGKANSDIGTILGMSPATVKKHFEHIFEKLGVENRTAAIAHVHQWWSDRPA